MRSRQRNFRFENRWLAEKDLKGVIGKCWNGFSDLDLISRLTATDETLMIWGSRAGTNFRKDKKDLEVRLKAMQDNRMSFRNEDFSATRCALG